MGIRGSVILLFFLFAVVAALFNPFWGVLAYFGHYYLWPEKQWWGEILESNGVRVSLTISAITCFSFLVHWGRIRQRTTTSLLHSQEVLYFLFVCYVGLTSLWGVVLEPEHSVQADSLTKLAKVGVFLFILTHVVNNELDYRRLTVFMYSVGGVYLGWVALTLPASYYSQGRINHLGGPDFSSTNYLSAHFIAMGILGLAITARSQSWRGKVMPLIGGALVANGYILTQSRGGLVAMGAAVVAAFVFVEKKMRLRIMAIGAAVAVGGLLLVDDNFLQRMTTITADDDERDVSAASRIEVWQGGLNAAQDYPLGVGPDNFPTTIGVYVPKHAGRDAHNTYIRALVEIGPIGLLIFMMLVANALLTLRRTALQARKAGRLDICYDVLALQLIIVVYLTSGATGTYLYTEATYIYLLLPTCLERVVSCVASDTGIKQGAVTYHGGHFVSQARPVEAYN